MDFAKVLALNDVKFFAGFRTDFTDRAGSGDPGGVQSVTRHFGYLAPRYERCQPHRVLWAFVERPALTTEPPMLSVAPSLAMQPTAPGIYSGLLSAPPDHPSGTRPELRPDPLDQISEPPGTQQPLTLTSPDRVRSTLPGSKVSAVKFLRRR